MYYMLEAECISFILKRYGVRNITQAVLIFFFFCINLYVVVSLQRVITFRRIPTGPYLYFFSVTIRIRDDVCGCLSSCTTVCFA